MEFHKKEGLLAGAQKAKVQSSWPRAGDSYDISLFIDSRVHWRPQGQGEHGINSPFGPLWGRGSG